MPGDPGSAVQVDRRSLPEAFCPQPQVPPSFAYLVSHFLVALHSADRETARAGLESEPSTREPSELSKNPADRTTGATNEPANPK